MKYLLLLIFISLLSLSLQISITQPTERSGNFIATQMCFGTPAECMSGALNFGSCKSFVADSTMRPDLNNQYRVGNSKTFSLIRPEPIDYTYERTEVEPEPVKVYGYPVIINDELKDLAIKNLPNFIPAENEVIITKDNFDQYLTNSYLDTTIQREDTFSVPLLIILLMIFVMICLFLFTIYF